MPQSISNRLKEIVIQCLSIYNKNFKALTQSAPGRRALAVIAILHCNHFRVIESDRAELRHVMSKYRATFVLREPILMVSYLEDLELSSFTKPPR